MKVVILAGGLGTRLGEETSLKPKPMVEIGGRPILWHIMKIYSSYGFNDFIVLAGYKKEVIYDYFDNYRLRQSNVTFDLANNTRTELSSHAEPWKVTVLDTGKDTLTGGRLRQAKEFVGNETFMLTYGDGVSDVNIPALIRSHKESGAYATVTTVQPEGRFGIVEVDPNGRVTNFQEKPKNESWINGGYFVLEPKIFDYIPDRDSAIWEKEPLQNLARDGQLNAYKHRGFWRPMDMLKDKQDLNKMWENGNAPWKIWDKQTPTVKAHQGIDPYKVAEQQQPQKH